MAICVFGVVASSCEEVVLVGNETYVVKSGTCKCCLLSECHGVIFCLRLSDVAGQASRAVNFRAWLLSVSLNARRVMTRSVQRSDSALRTSDRARHRIRTRASPVKVLYQNCFSPWFVSFGI